jgi:hypothetical protein
MLCETYWLTYLVAIYIISKKNIYINITCPKEISDIDGTNNKAFISMLYFQVFGHNAPSVDTVIQNATFV